MTDTSGRSSFLAACLAELRSASVPFCISRNHDEFWKDGPSDVDMMVSPARLNDAVRCLEAAAEASGFRLAARTWFDNLSLVFHAPGPHFVRIDLDTAVRWRSRTLLTADCMLATRIEDENLPIPSPHHGTLVLLCQCAWAGKVKPSYRERLKELISNGPDAAGVVEFIADRFRFGKPSMSRLIENGDVEELRKCFQHAPVNRQRVRNTVALVIRSVRRLFNPPGIVVDCHGLPDAVRSSTANRLELLFPAAKASRGNDSIPRLMSTMFKGGILWNDVAHNRIGVIAAKCWGGQGRTFRWNGGQIHHLGHGRTASAEAAADFIGSVLADSFAKAR